MGLTDEEEAQEIAHRKLLIMFGAMQEGITECEWERRYIEPKYWIYNKEKKPKTMKQAYKSKKRWEEI